MDLRCRNCQRFIGSVTSLVGRIQCPSCKTWLTFKIDSRVSVAAKSA